MTLKEFENKWGHVDRNYTTFEEELELVDDAFEMYEQTGFLETFESPYDDKSKNGLPFKIIRRASYVHDDIDLEYLPQWVVEFENREQMFCYPEEICKIEKTITIMKAKEINFNPSIRVLVPAGGDDTHNETELAKLIAYDTIINWTKEEILEWIFDFSTEPIDSPDKYDGEYDDN